MSRRGSRPNIFRGHEEKWIAAPHSFTSGSVRWCYSQSCHCSSTGFTQTKKSSTWKTLTLNQSTTSLSIERDAEAVTHSKKEERNRLSKHHPQKHYSSSPSTVCGSGKCKSWGEKTFSHPNYLSSWQIFYLIHILSYPCARNILFSVRFKKQIPVVLMGLMLLTRRSTLEVSWCTLCPLHIHAVIHHTMSLLYNWFSNYKAVPMVSM